MSDAGSNGTIDQIIAAVRDYLVSHPDAVDTAEGIANGWIPASRVEAFRPQIELVLDLLVKQGTLTRRVLPGGRCVYSSAVKTAAQHVAVEPKRK